MTLGPLGPPLSNWALGCLDTGSPHRTTAEYTSPLPLFLLLEALRDHGIPWHVPCTWPPPSSGLWRSLLTTVFQPLTVDKRLRGDGCFAHCNLNSLTLFHVYLSYQQLGASRAFVSFCKYKVVLIYYLPFLYIFSKKKETKNIEKLVWRKLLNSPLKF